MVLAARSPESVSVDDCVDHFGSRSNQDANETAMTSDYEPLNPSTMEPRKDCDQSAECKLLRCHSSRLSRLLAFVTKISHCRRSPMVIAVFLELMGQYFARWGNIIQPGLHDSSWNVAQSCIVLCSMPTDDSHFWLAEHHERYISDDCEVQHDHILQSQMPSEWWFNPQVCSTLWHDNVSYSYHYS